MKKIILATTIIVFIVSCEKTVVVDVPLSAPKLVVNGLINAGDVFKVKVTKSEPLLTNIGNYKVSNVALQLFENGLIKDTFLYSTNTDLYTAKNGSVPLQGKKYLLTAVLNGFTKIEAETITPTNIAIQSITRRVNVRTDNSGNALDEIKIKFVDNASESNYYLFKIKRPISSNATIVNYEPIFCIRSSDIDIERGSNSDPTDNNNCIEKEFLITDKNFNGNSKEIILYIRSFDLETYINPVNLKKYKAIVEMNSITTDHYKYRKSLGTYRDNEDNPFSEPVLVFTNIKNGYGIFSSFTIARDTIR
jgi:hypothetical protein